ARSGAVGPRPCRGPRQSGTALRGTAVRLGPGHRPLRGLPRADRRPGPSRNLLALVNRFDLDLEADRLAQHEAAGLEGRVEADAKVVLVDLAGCREAHAGPHLRMRDDTEVLGVEGDRLGGAADRQVAGQREIGAPLLNRAARAEGDRWVVLHVQEVGRTDVRVTVRIAGVDTGGVDRSLHLGIFGLLGHLDGPGELAELAAYLADHQVTNHK